MGEDFIRKTEQSYRPSMQRSVAKRLMGEPLLSSEERTTTTYSCRLLQRSAGIAASRLLLHRREDRTIEILDEHRVVGLVEGEPSEDLNQLLDQLQSPADMLRVEMVQTDNAFMDFKIADEDRE